MGILTWLANTVVGQLLKGLFGAVLEGIDRWRAADAQRDAGRLEQQAADQAAAIEAQRRADAAAARPRDGETNSKRIGDGTI